MLWKSRMSRTGVTSVPPGNSTARTMVMVWSSLEMVVGVQATGPAQLAAADAVEIVVHRMYQPQGAGLPPDPDHIPGLDGKIHLAVAGNLWLDIPPLAHADFHRAVTGDGDGSAGEGMGVHGHQYHGIQLGVQDGSA